LFVKVLSNPSGNKLEPISNDHKIQIISIIIIPNAEVDLSLKKPPGYVEIVIVIAIINNINPILP
jgi:hypothetical protein